jgi:aspartate aminotransferase, cytoplasmic
MSILGSIEELPLDEAYFLTAAFKADSDPQKVSLGAGVYRDNNAKPWVLSSVKEVMSALRSKCAVVPIKLIGRKNCI